MSLWLIDRAGPSRNSEEEEGVERCPQTCRLCCLQTCRLWMIHSDFTRWGPHCSGAIQTACEVKVYEYGQAHTLDEADESDPFMDLFRATS